MSAESARTRHVRGILIATVSVLFLSPDTLLIRLFDRSVPETFFWRALLVGLVIFAFLLVRHPGELTQSHRRLGWVGFWAILCIIAGNILFLIAVQLTTVANTLFLFVGLSPIATLLISRFFLGEAIRPSQLIAITLSFLAVAIIVSGTAQQPRTELAIWGDLAALGAAFSLALYLVLIRRARNYSLLPATGIANLLGALLFLPFVLVKPFPGPEIGYILLLGLVFLPVAYIGITVAPRLVPAPEVSLLLLLETIIGPLLVWWFLGEAVLGATLVGGGLLLITLAGLNIWTLTRTSAD